MFLDDQKEKRKFVRLKLNWEFSQTIRKHTHLPFHPVLPQLKTEATLLFKTTFCPLISWVVSLVIQVTVARMSSPESFHSIYRRSWACTQLQTVHDAQKRSDMTVITVADSTDAAAADCDWTAHVLEPEKCGLARLLGRWRIIMQVFACNALDAQ